MVIGTYVCTITRRMLQFFHLSLHGYERRGKRIGLEYSTKPGFWRPAKDRSGREGRLGWVERDQPKTEIQDKLSRVVWGFTL